jgi:hypothetical protein
MNNPLQVWPTLLALLAVCVLFTPSLAQEIETLQKGGSYDQDGIP